MKARETAQVKHQASTSLHWLHLVQLETVEREYLVCLFPINSARLFSSLLFSLRLSTPDAYFLGNQFQSCRLASSATVSFHRLVGSAANGSVFAWKLCRHLLFLFLLPLPLSALPRPALDRFMPARHLEARARTGPREATSSSCNKFVCHGREEAQRGTNWREEAKRGKETQIESHASRRESIKEESAIGSQTAETTATATSAQTRLEAGLKARAGPDKGYLLL